MSNTIAASEQRTIDVDVTELRTQGNTLCGHAAVFGVLSDDLGGFREQIAPGAFAQVLAGTPDVRCLVNHDPSQVLARTKSGTLRLTEDERGLAFEADLPSSPLGENVREAVRRGDIDGASFRFVVGREEWDEDVRTVATVKELHDVTVATYGAYPAASVELRTRNATNTKGAEMPEAPAATDEPIEVVEENELDESRNGGLRVEDRTAAPVPVEERIRDALLSVRKGENRALSTASTLAPGELSSFLFDRLRAASVALASGISVISTDRDTVTFPRLTVDPSPGWYNEAAAITAGDPTLDSVVATPRKAAHRVEFSNEVLDDSDPSAADVIRDNLVKILGLKLDLGIYEGTGSAPEIRGLKNVAGIGTVSLGVNGAALTNLDPIADAMAQLEAANAQAGALVMHPRTWAAIRKLKDAPSGNNRPLMIDAAGSPSQGIRPSIYGVPVFVSSQLSITETQGTAVNASSVYVYQPDQLYLIRRQDVEVELDRSRLFNTDQSEMRGKLRADLVVPNATAVSRILGIIP